jgi:hypothetical protein
VQLLLARVRPAVRDLLDRSGAGGEIGVEHIHARVLEGVVAHLCASGTGADAFLGLSGDLLRLLQQAVSDMLAQASGDRRVQLETMHDQLGGVIDKIDHGDI